MITFVCSQLGGGKSTYSKLIAKELGHTFVEVSSIVRDIVGASRREDLQGHPEIDIFIINHIKEELSKNSLIVSGVRQVSILEAFPEAVCVWIDTPKSIRYSRYMERASSKDTLSEEAFNEAEQKDIELGVLEVKDYIMRRGDS